MLTRSVVHVESGRVLLSRARWCDSFATRLRGFTFRRSLAAGEGLVLVERADSRVSAAITMLFVFFDLAVIWVNDSGQIVDTTLARAWRLSYTPQAPARYAVEGHPSLLQQVKAGDHIQFLENKT